MKARKFVVKNIFNGVPKRDDYDLVTYELPPLQDGEILVKAEWISVDPYQRIYNTMLQAPYDQFSLQVGTVEDSKNPEYPVGTSIVSYAGWCDYSVLKPDPTAAYPGRIYKTPELFELPKSLAVGAVGMPGATAYFAFVEQCKPKSGETVVVTGAAGAVGSLVGQMAKIKGCKVIGFAGSDDKVQWLEQKLGFDKVFNYKTENISEALKTAAPNGVDIYFDNVGGELSSKIIYHMNDFGRVSVCGSISSYNDTTKSKATILQPIVVSKQLQVQGFLIWNWGHRWPEAFKVLIGWIRSGKMIAPEHVSEGFEKVFDAFIGMLDGDNFGKAMVKV